MKKRTHDPLDYVRNLQQLLSSDKKIIGFLFGAGTSLVKNPLTKEPYVPAIIKMTQMIVDKLNVDLKYKYAIEELKSEIGENFTIETLLSKLELKKQVVGNAKLNGLNCEEIQSLISAIKDKVHTLASVHRGIDRDKLIHSNFAEWIGKADRKKAVEIFTTNYDYLFEVGFEHSAVPYYDGFTGSYEPFFNSESVEDFHFLPQQTKLWKIHGSLGWHYDADRKRVIRKEADNKDILIYPSTLKYDQSRKQPYTSLGDRLSNFIKQPDTVLIVAGYSFGDEHINERINTALASNPLGHIYVLYYDIVWDDHKKTYSFTEDCAIAKLAMANTKISVFATKFAVIGGIYGEWQLKNEPDKDDSLSIDIFFDEDACENENDNIGVKIEQKWTGKGELKLPEFESFVRFLRSMVFISMEEVK